MKETVIVIGSGIVARSLSATLSWLGDEVVNIDCNSQESLNRLPGILRLGKVSCVYHLEDGTKQGSLDAFYYVCDNCKMRGVKLVYASAPVESGLNVAERYAKFYNREATGVRLFNVYGPNPCQGTLLHSLLYGECVKLEHNGEDIRCFTFIDNAVEGLIYASASGDAILNCVNDEPMSVLDFCREMQQIYEQVRQVAPSDATVLIRGGSGTGKEMIARAIVNLSARKDKPFITLNCAALPENLVESELFGHEKGAFTGAVNRRIGRAEAANGGTLFLDEIGDLTMQTQVKLLRFLQERTFSRVGSNEELHSDVRFLAATSRNLEELIAQGKFREDLFYRLNIFPIAMPDLAKRKSDIILLAEHFIEKMNLRYGKKIVRLSTTAINLLMSYHWPGNVRELENCMERAVLTASDDCIHSYNLPPSLQTSLSTGQTGATSTKIAPLDVMLNNYEREIITEAIKRNNGNLSAAGRDLGVSPRMMNYRMNKLGIKSK